MAISLKLNVYLDLWSSHGGSCAIPIWFIKEPAFHVWFVQATDSNQLHDLQDLPSAPGEAMLSGNASDSVYHLIIYLQNESLLMGRLWGSRGTRRGREKERRNGGREGVREGGRKKKKQTIIDWMFVSTHLKLICRSPNLYCDFQMGPLGVIMVG